MHFLCMHIRFCNLFWHGFFPQGCKADTCQPEMCKPERDPDYGQTKTDTGNDMGYGKPDPGQDNP